MTSDHSVDAGGYRVEVERHKIMKHVNVPACQFDQFCLGKLSAASTAIDISPDCRHRSKVAEPVEDGGIADVSGMQDVLGIAQRQHGLGPEQAMGVGDDANQHRQIPRVSRVRGSR